MAKIIVAGLKYKPLLSKVSAEEEIPYFNSSVFFFVFLATLADFHSNYFLFGGWLRCRPPYGH